MRMEQLSNESNGCRAMPKFVYCVKKAKQASSSLFGGSMHHWHHLPQSCSHLYNFRCFYFGAGVTSWHKMALKLSKNLASWDRVQLASHHPSKEHRRFKRKWDNCSKLFWWHIYVKLCWMEIPLRCSADLMGMMEGCVNFLAVWLSEGKVCSQYSIYRYF